MVIFAIYVELGEVWCLVLTLIQMTTFSSVTFSDLGMLGQCYEADNLKSSPLGASEIIMLLGVWFRCSLLRSRPSLSFIAYAFLGYGECLHASSQEYFSPCISEETTL